MPRCHLEATNLQPKRKKGVAPVSGGVEKVGRFDPTPCRKNWKMLYDAFMMHSCCIHDAMCDCMLQFFSSLLFFHGRKQEEWNIDIHWYVETFLKLSWNFLEILIYLSNCWDVGMLGLSSQRIRSKSFWVVLRVLRTTTWKLWAESCRAMALLTSTRPRRRTLRVWQISQQRFAYGI